MMKYENGTKAKGFFSIHNFARMKGVRPKEMIDK